MAGIACSFAPRARIDAEWAAGAAQSGDGAATARQLPRGPAALRSPPRQDDVVGVRDPGKPHGVAAPASRPRRAGRRPPHSAPRRARPRRQHHVRPLHSAAGEPRRAHHRGLEPDVGSVFCAYSRHRDVAVAASRPAVGADQPHGAAVRRMAAGVEPAALVRHRPVERARAWAVLERGRQPHCCVAQPARRRRTPGRSEDRPGVSGQSRRRGIFRQVDAAQRHRAAPRARGYRHRQSAIRCGWPNAGRGGARHHRSWRGGAAARRIWRGARRNRPVDHGGHHGCAFVRRTGARRLGRGSAFAALGLGSRQRDDALVPGRTDFPAAQPSRLVEAD